jgi:hypothetical protein
VLNILLPTFIVGAWVILPAAMLDEVFFNNLSILMLTASLASVLALLIPKWISRIPAAR